MSGYKEIEPIEYPIAADRQAAKRHYGVHPYFTRRPYNVVRKYILHYSRIGDVVLDPFGGSGVTPIEAFLENRIGIQNDINPLANLIAKGIADLAIADLREMVEALDLLESRCSSRLRSIERLPESQLQTTMRSVNLPPDVPLPRSSDADTLYDLFMPTQLIGLAILKEEIDKIGPQVAQSAMLLAWSATLAKLNKTFLSAAGRLESRGGSSIFSIYRYKLAKKPIALPLWETFYERAVNVLDAKSEIDRVIATKHLSGGWRGEFKVRSEDIEDLASEFEGTIDYIFTDPPYGGHICYLDLSIMWNIWLGIAPKEKVRAKELIVGGDLNLSEEMYTERLARSIECCVRMLKPDRWLSVVFQHWNTAYFDAILSAATQAGAELRAAVSQVGDPIWSMHKKKNQSVLAGELILTFSKTGNRVVRRNNGKTFNLENVVDEVLAQERGGKIFGEYLLNRVVISAWKHGAIDVLKISKEDFLEMIRRKGWHYDDASFCWINGTGKVLFS